MKRALSTLALAAAIALPAAVQAKPVQEEDIKSGKVQRDPTMGYIFVNGATRQSGLFLRVPDEETRAAYEKDRAKAFAKALKHYQSQLAEWSASAEGSQGRQVADKPEEPTLDSFVYDPIELRDSESFGPFFVFAKGDTFSYLNAVKPGTYIYFGPMLVGANGTGAGMCYCLGTVRFEVKPGVVTDLGTSLVNSPKWDADMDVNRLQLAAANVKRVAAGKDPIPFAKGSLAYGLPPSLAAWPAVKAELRASPKMNNFFGATVTRMAPIPGVLAYHRDIVVDERTGQEVASPTIISRAKIKK